MDMRCFPEIEERIKVITANTDSDSQISDLVDVVLREGINHEASDAFVS